MGASLITVTADETYASAFRGGRRAARFVWPIWSLAAALCLAAFGIVLATLDASAPERALRGSTALVGIAYATVGARIASRHARNPVGWLVLGMGVAYGVVAVAEELSILALFARHDRELGAFALALDRVAATVPVALAAFVLLLFPDGRPISRAWLLAGAFVVAACGTLAVRSLFVPLDDSILGAPDPFAAQLRVLESAPMYPLLLQIVTLSLIVCGVALVWRLVRSEGAQRQQIKWVVSAGALAVVVNFLANMLTDSRLLAYLQLLGLLAVPASIGIAMQRYRLYQIDAILGRALVYGLLTALLAAIVTAVLGLMQRAFIATTGQTSEAALVLTTIVLVLVFTPTRELIQRSIDQRWKPEEAVEAVATDARAFAELRDPARLRARYLAACVRSLAASGGRVERRDGESWRAESAVGEDVPRAAVEMRLGPDVRIILGPTSDGGPYTQDQLRRLRESATAIRDAMVTAV